MFKERNDHKKQQCVRIRRTETKKRKVTMNGKTIFIIVAVTEWYSASYREIHLRSWQTWIRKQGLEEAEADKGFLHVSYGEPISKRWTDRAEEVLVGELSTHNYLPFSPFLSVSLRFFLSLPEVGLYMDAIFKRNKLTKDISLHRTEFCRENFNPW